MRLSPSLFKSSSGSSNRWLARQKADPYVRARTSPSSSSAGTETYRARSAFKLVSLSTKYPTLLGRGKTVVDLGAAPGGWSQVAAARGGGGRVIAVDIQPLGAIPGVEVLKGDFLSVGVRRRVGEIVGGRQGEDGGRGVDTVLSDMMAPMSGVRGRDVQASLDLCAAAMEFGRGWLRVGREDEAGVEKGEEVAGMDERSGKGQGEGGSGETKRGEVKGRLIKGRKVYSGGSMVLKYFAHPDLDAFKREELEPWFAKVAVEKPKESRSGESLVKGTAGSAAVVGRRGQRRIS